MMICAKYQNANIMTATQCSVYIVKVIKHEMASYSDCKAAVSKKGHSRHSDCVNMLEFIQQLKVMEDLSERVWTLVGEMGFGVVSMKLALNENVHNYLYKRHKG